MEQSAPTPTANVEQTVNVAPNAPARAVEQQSRRVRNQTASAWIASVVHRVRVGRPRKEVVAIKQDALVSTANAQIALVAQL